MKEFSIWEPASRSAVEIGLKKMGRNISEFKNRNLPREDFLLSSSKYPIFVVADGVTLIQYLIDKDKNEYPNPSPAGEVARIFSESLIQAAEERYASFQEPDIKDIFMIGNKAVEIYNRSHGREKSRLNYWDVDLYAATSSFLILKDGKAYWGSICDSYVVHFDKHGSLKFVSPACHSLKEAEPVSFTGDSSDQKSRAEYVWRFVRNAINKKGERVGYGVITGEPNAVKYLCSGVLNLEKGDIVGVVTDGFEEYVKLPEFVSLFTKWSPDLEDDVKVFTSEKAQVDPEKYGHERSLIMAVN